MAKIIFIRHAETLEGGKGLLLGQLEGTLTKKGKLKINGVAEILKGFGVQKIYSSDLKRAVDSTKLVANILDISEIIYFKEIRERSAGIYEGKSPEEIDWEKYELKSLPYRKHQDGESFIDVENRIKPFIKSLSKSKENTLVVSHSVVMHMILKIIKNLNFENALELKIKDKFIIWDNCKNTIETCPIDKTIKHI